MKATNTINMLEKGILLPPHPSKCQTCAADHRPEQPHNPDSMYLKYNNTTYQWIGDKWWQQNIMKWWIFNNLDPILEVKDNGTVRIMYTLLGWWWWTYIDTHHTPEELVEIWYMWILWEWIPEIIDNSFIIMNRLRKWVSEIRDTLERQWTNPYAKDAIKMTANCILDLFDRIINEEPNTLKDTEVWNPQPGDTILVRYEDDVREDPWMPRKFIRMDGLRFVCQIEWGRPGEERSWEIAMPNNK